MCRLLRYQPGFVPVFASATLSHKSKTYSWLVITFTTNISLRNYRFTTNRCILQLEIVCVKNTKVHNCFAISIYNFIFYDSMNKYISCYYYWCMEIIYIIRCMMITTEFTQIINIYSLKIDHVYLNYSQGVFPQRYLISFTFFLTFSWMDSKIK